MHNPTPKQRLNCMRLSSMLLSHSEYANKYASSMVAVILNHPHKFPSMSKFKGQPDSPEMRVALAQTFGFSNFDHPEWMCFLTACMDIESFAKKSPQGPSLMDRLKNRITIPFSMDP